MASYTILISARGARVARGRVGAWDTKDSSELLAVMLAIITTILAQSRFIPPVPVKDDINEARIGLGFEVGLDLHTCTGNHQSHIFARTGTLYIVGYVVLVDWFLIEKLFLILSPLEEEPHGYLHACG